MNISELYEMQKALDARIIEEKGLQGQDLLPNTVLALQVEIGELANEWRGFKHWSNDREPRGEMKVQCPKCHGEGTHGDLGGNLGYIEVDCTNCDGNCEVTINPLLEEYVDCLHFFLSIAHQRNWPESIYLYVEAIEDIRETGFDGGITGAFLEMEYWLLRSYMENKPMETVEKNLKYSTKEFCFRNAFFIFIALGIVGFGFSWELIAEAYLAKNRINHMRQENGY